MRSEPVDRLIGLFFCICLQVIVYLSFASMSRALFAVVVVACFEFLFFLVGYLTSGALPFLQRFCFNMAAAVACIALALMDVYAGVYGYGHYSMILGFLMFALALYMAECEIVDIMTCLAECGRTDKEMNIRLTMIAYYTLPAISVAAYVAIGTMLSLVLPIIGIICTFCFCKKYDTMAAFRHMT